MEIYYSKLNQFIQMKIQLEVSKNDIAILDAISRLVQNNRDKFGKDYVRAVDMSKSLKNQSDSINWKRYERKINSSTLIHDAL